MKNLDHPLHFFPMLGGTWSFSNIRNRIVGKELFRKLATFDVIRPYNNRIYLEDQFFLIHHIWPIAKQNATIHDSYYCKDFGGEPFPTQRPSHDCFISCSNCCSSGNSSDVVTEKRVGLYSVGKECPVECRKEINWNYC